MHLRIAGRQFVYSHVPGTYCLLPGTTLRLQIFPALIRVFNMTTSIPILIAEYEIPIIAPTKDFTIELDLDKGWIRVWGNTTEGFFRYHIQGLLNSNAILINMEKSPTLNPKTKDELSETIYLPPQGKRLSLGSHKSPDYTLMRRRLDMNEIFPIWLRLAQLIPVTNSSSNSGTLSLFQQCQEALDANKPENILQNFENVFLAGFESMFSPRLQDDDFQGFSISNISKQDTASPLELITRGANFIQNIFVKSSDEEINILPHLPPEFHCGRFLNIDYPAGTIHFEWSKKLLRQMIFVPKICKPIQFTFQKSLKCFRLRQGFKDRGKKIYCGSLLELNPNSEYFFDNFEK